MNLSLDSKLGAESIGPQLDAWLERCRTAHAGRCAVPDRPSWVPKRLVDLGALADGRVVVRETAPLPGPKPRFVTLSHCWGGPAGPRMLRLLPENRGTFMDPGAGIRVAQLPRNFRDAAEVARRLKTRYIWIDSLCILQDGAEFRAEGRLMHLVYRHSYCNLAAAASRDCQGGLFQDRPNVENPGGDVVETSADSRFGKGKWRVFPAEYWSDQLLTEPLYRRGWVFQGRNAALSCLLTGRRSLTASTERMLSPRILHFAAGQVFWDCASTTACEVLPDGLPWQLDAASSTERYWRERLQLTQQKPATTSSTSLGTGTGTKPRPKFVGSADVSFEAFWREAVGNYTACDLTQPTDRLLAVWGVAKRVRDQFRLDHGGEDYGAGLWSSRLAEQLAWRSRDPGRARRPAVLARLWPSWSWASLVGPVDLQPRASEPGQFYAATDHRGGAVGFALEAGDEGRAGAEDVPRELRSRGLAVRSVFVGVVLEEQRVAPGDESTQGGLGQDSVHEYPFRLVYKDGLEGDRSTGTFRAFPDSASEFLHFSDIERHLVLLTASGNQDQAWDADSWASCEEQVTSAPSWVHGTGIIVVKVAPGEEDGEEIQEQYRRIGVCNFEGLGSDDFTRLEQSHVSDIWLI